MDIPRIAVRGHGDLIISVPHLLGFYPYRSMVIVMTGASPPGQLRAIVRLDLPDETDHEHTASLAAAVRDLLGTNATSEAPAHHAFLIVVDDRPTTADLPHRHLVAQLADTAIPLAHALWTSGIGSGNPWRCYHDGHCDGLLGDPTISPAAAAAVLTGRVTHASREDLAALLTTTDTAALARRAALLQAPPTDSHLVQLGLVHSAVADLRHGRLPETDDQIVRLAHALDSAPARELGIAYLLDADHDTQPLWRTLVRETPAPHRVHAAFLLGLAAHLDGDGSLASLAFEVVLADPPSALITHLVLAIQQSWMSSAALRNLLRWAVDHIDLPPHD
jgi:hypothetical protein